MSTPVPAAAVLFGAGEHISATGLALRRDGAPLTLWTRDCAAADPDQNTYGSWPFVLDVRPGGGRLTSWTGLPQLGLGLRVFRFLRV